MKIFISYRRSDSEYITGRIYDRLEVQFGKQNLFMDVETIPLGVNFKDFLNGKVKQCDVLLAVIGDQWLSARDKKGKPRLDNPSDFVRIEIEAALQRGIPVIPLFVRGVSQLSTEDIPITLSELALSNGIEIRAGRDFHKDMDALIYSIEMEYGSKRTGEKQPLESIVNHPPRRPSTTQVDTQNNSNLIYIKQPFEIKLVSIPTSDFLMGSSPQVDNVSWPREYPRHKLTLPNFFIGCFPITNQQFEFFVKASNQPTPDHWLDGKIPSGKENHPVVNVTWYDAIRFCQWFSNQSEYTVRLPTEVEWEKAARGENGRIFPWGNKFDTEKANTSESFMETTTPVGKYSPKGDSPYGVADMAGNVWEWTLSLWGRDWEQPLYRYPYNPEDGRENVDASENILRIIRGGAFFNTRNFSRCAFRDARNPDFNSGYCGFRVVLGEI